MQTAQARETRDQAIAHATLGADNRSPNWSENAYTFLEGYARISKTFTAETAREAAERWRAVDTPPDKRAWGGVFQKAVRLGIIKREGFETASDPKVHCSINTLWRSLIVRKVA